MISCAAIRSSSVGSTVRSGISSSAARRRVCRVRLMLAYRTAPTRNFPASSIDGRFLRMLSRTSCTTSSASSCERPRFTASVRRRE